VSRCFDIGPMTVPPGLGWRDLWKIKVVDHAPTGSLELRMGDFTYGRKLRDRKKENLEVCWPHVWVVSANGPSILDLSGALAGRSDRNGQATTDCEHRSEPHLEMGNFPADVRKAAEGFVDHLSRCGQCRRRLTVICGTLEHFSAPENRRSVPCISLIS
jgi:hypothetical protein